ncbi:hypothetical protein PQB35_gp61 [Ochrobactrum phage vB_OspP_OH]|uniref:Uncharacterized protein n=1 Tax=Ochrobactrum phage vB_OspP_OH TaxID=2712957 RepID=A0A6G6XXP9_9CAUD|nr:hypothetical protein PQB35_gp61 [Ochrobactrum phage vB_OspP_OH]QIG66117.1 hypothetical protein phiOH_p61 [Ochrobactrum phage vB_OspP_OH]
MTEPKKTEESKKPESEAPKKDEATVKAASNTTADASKPAEPAKETPKEAAKPNSDGGANIQTKHTEIKTGQLAGIKAPHKDPENFSTKPEEETPPETMSDAELRNIIGDVAFESDVNTTETKLAPAAPVKGSAAAAAPSIKRLKSLVYAYPKDAKDGTVVFGYGGISITIGDLRAVVSVL